MNKKMQRLMGALLLALTLLLLSSVALAKDAAQLDYADIALRVPKENKQLDILQRSLPMLQKVRDDMKNMQDNSGGSSDAIRYLIEAYRGILQNPASPEQEAWAMQMLSSLAAFGQGSASAAINFDSIDLQISQMRIQIPQTQAQLINAGQKLFITYHTLRDNIKKMQSSRELLQESLQLAKVQQTAGVGTMLAVKEAELALAELDTSIKQLESQCAQLLNQLKLIVGWPQEQIMKLGGIPRPNREFFAKIDQTEDIKSAHNNSYSLKLKQAEQRYTDSSDQQIIIKLSIEAQKEQIHLAVSTQYYKIEEINNTLLLEEQRLAVAEEKIKQSRLQHQVGLLADLALQAEEKSYTTQKDAVAGAMNSLFWEIENYKTILAGLN